MNVIHIASEIRTRYPGYTALGIWAEGLEPALARERIADVTRESERWQCSHFPHAAVAEHPHIQAWRAAYSGFGVKPSKYLSSVEALLRRVLKGEGIPRVNPLVDLYNAISVRHILPIGGEDLDALRGVPTLTVASGEEGRGDALNAPRAGEVVWRDDEGVTCRRWNWRQDDRTRLTLDTSRAFFVLERLAPFPLEHVVAAGRELRDHLSQMGPRAMVTERLEGDLAGL